jgi:hypothetical protein
MIQDMVLLIWIAKENKTGSREHKMNITTKSVLGTMPAISAAPAASNTSSKTLANLILAAGVAALVVGVDQMIDNWAESHVVAAWLALWAVAVLAIVLLRGLTRHLAQNLMTGLVGACRSQPCRRAFVVHGADRPAFDERPASGHGPRR